MEIINHDQNVIKRNLKSSPMEICDIKSKHNKLSDSRDDKESPCLDYFE
jgi:hypothetical protein